MTNPIATINYNGSEDTIALVHSLKKSGESFDLIIVDNQSSRKNEVEKIVSEISKHYGISPSNLSYSNDRADGGYLLNLAADQIVSVIRGRENFGFAKGTNIGLQYAIETYPKAKYLTILNNDTEVTSGFLTKAIDGIKKNNLAAAMGTILYYGYAKPYIWSIGGTIDYIKAQGVHLGKDNEFVSITVKEGYVKRQFISGCFTVFRYEPLVEIGLLDEDYFFAGEEYQYSVDLTRKYEIGWIPESIIYHKSIKGIGNGSSHKISDLKWQYNAYMVKIIFINKNRGRLYRFIWHQLLRIYILTKLKKKYLSITEYGEKYYQLLRDELFKNLKKNRFVKTDFEDFARLLNRE